MRFLCGLHTFEVSVELDGQGLGCLFRPWAALTSLHTASLQREDAMEVQVCAATVAAPKITVRGTASAHYQLAEPEKDLVCGTYH